MKNQFLIAALAACALSTSCKKDKTPANESTVIYIAGTQRDSLSGRDKSAVWKDGTLSYNNLSGNNSYYAHAITLAGNDVYTTGFENQPGIWKCHVWKNGQHLYSLGDGYSYGNGIAFVGSDTYVAGYAYKSNPITRYAMLWKNQSTGVTILDSSQGSAEAHAITVSGNDVYVAGYAGSTGKIWKNGLEIPMNNASGCTIKGIVVAGTDVYAAGYTSGSLLRYWKNGVATDITIPPGKTAYINGMTVNGNDVYLAGWEFNGTVGIATYWKNGVAVPLGDGVRNSRANGIAVKGNDVYVVGDERGATGFSEYATLWKNGSRNTIGYWGSRAMAIAVK